MKNIAFEMEAAAGAAVDAAPPHASPGPQNRAVAPTK